MNNKPTVEQALIFKQLRERDWCGVRDHIIKECLEATNFDVKAAYRYLQGHFIPPRPGYWCPRWSYISHGSSDSDEGAVKWYLVKRDGKKVILLDENFKSINDTGKKIVEYYTLNEDGKADDVAGTMEQDTDGTEGHQYATFVDAEAALERSGDSAIYIQLPSGTRICRVNSPVETLDNADISGPTVAVQN